jgi:hypothetical protein
MRASADRCGQRSTMPRGIVQAGLRVVHTFWTFIRSVFRVLSEQVDVFCGGFEFCIPYTRSLDRFFESYSTR